jgi:hypothetical protein
MKKDLGIDLVKVTIPIPKAVNDLVTKLAAVEGTEPSEWYWDAIRGYVESLLGDAHDVFDVQRVIANNGLKDLVNVLD